MSGAEVLSRFKAAGYILTLTDAEIRASGPATPPDELRTLADKNRDALKAAVLLANPPAWLSKLFDLYWSGHETPVRRSGPSGKAEVYLVSVSIKNIVAAVGVELGIPQTRWSEIHPEVEEALGTWEGAA